MCLNDRWFNDQGHPICSLCARRLGIDKPKKRKKRKELGL